MSRKLKSGDPSQKSRSGSERTAQLAPAEGARASGKDAILIHGVSQDGETMAVLRAREDRVEAGVLRAVKAGQPLSGEVLKLTPRPEFPLLCDVEVQVPAGTINAAGGSEANPRSEGSRGRPAQVATDSYRENWDAIWRKPGKKSLAN
jgi:hypothetical protein